MKKRHVAKLNAVKAVKGGSKKGLPAKPRPQHESQPQPELQLEPAVKLKYSAPKIMACGRRDKGFDLCPLRG